MPVLFRNQAAKQYQNYYICHRGMTSWPYLLKQTWSYVVCCPFFVQRSQHIQKNTVIKRKDIRTKEKLHSLIASVHAMLVFVPGSGWHGRKDAVELAEIRKKNLWELSIIRNGFCFKTHKIGCNHSALKTENWRHKKGTCFFLGIIEINCGQFFTFTGRPRHFYLTAWKEHWLCKEKQTSVKLNFTKWKLTYSKLNLKSSSDHIIFNMSLGISIPNIMAFGT